MNQKILLLAIALTKFSFLFSQGMEIEKQSYTTTSIADNESPTIDGLLNEVVWNKVPWDDEFVQHRPDNGDKPSQATRFKILYDNNFIYVGVQCFDNEPDSIVKRLSRRDGFEGDWINIAFDSYHDLRSCYSFNVTVAGVKGDEFLSNDGNNSDVSYNPIWFTKTSVDEQGWNAEMKIPLSQLRFVEAEDQVWGIQLTRKLFRKDERSVWQQIPLDFGGWVSKFGELHGLKNLKPKRQIEIQPYVLAQADKYPREEGNPFRTGGDQSITGGLDGKIGISNALTLDFTINPDFGQVEADPAALALDGFQIFFREQRPFFVENRNIFDFAVSQSAAGNTFGNDNIFYSRRIGKNPSGYPSLNDGEYASQPLNTTILGAAKLSGRNSKGWSIGILESMTDREYATINLEGNSRTEIVEPLTNYFVARAQKDFNDANTSVGGIISSTIRKNEGDLDFLRSTATTGGLDWNHRWKDRAWYFSGNTILSHVTGSKEAINNTQQSITHLFQRVDASHLSVDTNSTSLTGTGGNFKLGKVGGSNFIFESGMTWRSPELELNDLGFLRQADDIRHFTWAGYRWREPFSIFRSLAVNYYHWLVYDFEGNRNSTSWNVNTSGNFKNNWWAGCGSNINPLQFSNSELRGGPRYRYVPNANAWLWIDSDNRKKIQYGINITYQLSQDNARQFNWRSAWVRYQPTNALSITLESEYNNGHDQLQYVNNIETADGIKYIQARLDRETFASSLRLNYTINPNLTIQYYGQPFISKGKYSSFKSMINPTAKLLADKHLTYNKDQISKNENDDVYEIDEDMNGSMDYSFGNPNFTFFQFRSNLVLRWEYRPGSELFLVWSQGNVQFSNDQRGIFNRLGDEFSDNKLDNIFLLKATFRLSL